MTETRVAPAGGPADFVNGPVYAYKFVGGGPGCSIREEGGATNQVDTLYGNVAPTGYPWRSITITPGVFGAKVLVARTADAAAFLASTSVEAYAPPPDSNGNIGVKVYGSQNQPLDQQNGTNRLAAIAYGSQGLQLLQDNSAGRLITGSDAVSQFQRLALGLNSAGQNEAGNHYLAQDGSIGTATTAPIDLTNFSSAEFQVFVNVAVTGSTIFAWFLEVLDQNIAGGNVIDTIAMGSANDYRLINAAGSIVLGANADLQSASRQLSARRARRVRVRYNLTGALTGGTVSISFILYP